MRALRRLLAAAVVLVLPMQALHAQSSANFLSMYREDVARLVRAATSSDFAWRRLAELTDLHGPRLSGSDNLTRAIAWSVEKMKADGLENVHTEKVMVPHWIRGQERAELVDPPFGDVAMLGLGGTVATPPEGVVAEVLPVNNFDDLQTHAADAKGRIVLFNVPYTNYSETVTYRTTSAAAAAQFGAVGVLVRSVGPTGLRTAHTGSVTYAPGLPEIPAASISAEDANRIVRLTARGHYVRMRLVTGGHYEPDAESANVVAEIRGREKPDEIVLIGGHLDSWDVGTGAADDGVGCVATWEALRLMKHLGLRPRRTVRLVLFTNEENGLRGANAYADRYGEMAGNHVFALESDSGVLSPATFGFSGSTAARLMMAQIGALLTPLGLPEIGPGGGGADIGPIAQLGNVPTMAYLGDATRFFVFHHTAADTVERVAPDDLSRAAASIAAVTYVVAEMPERLPR
ncbi:MAG TPA: M20/M25/M40 family metallo-hydrolase [Vicinamibacterales bacterium]|jgi:carboxypeptidase Q|nr:M20/M25/M40 family metallo-hydrolase [Vicinamibacterales bacterium]